MAKRRLVGVKRSPSKPKTTEDPLSKLPGIGIRYGVDDRYQVPSSTRFEVLTEQWSYDLMNRRYWANRSASRRERAERAEKTLRVELEISNDILLRIANAENIEVEIVDHNPTVVHPQAAAVPWEYLISAGTRKLREKSPLITRRSVQKAPPNLRVPAKLLFVQNVPREFETAYEFDDEREVVKQGLGLTGISETYSKNESDSQIRNHIKQGFDVIHFTGFDSRQGGQLLKNKTMAERGTEAILVRNARGDAVEITAADIESEFGGKAGAPQLVFFNCHNSASELAARSISGGAISAIGFQDTIEDDTAEYLVGTLYREWRKADWNIHRAFKASWDSLRKTGTNLHGSGIVLWTAHSVFDTTLGVEAAPTARRKQPPAADLPLSRQVMPQITPRDEINYSLLHNEQPLFKTFILSRTAGTDPINVEIFVELNVGTESYPYRSTESVPAEGLIMTESIRIPLTSGYARALRERVVSTLFVEIKVENTTIYGKTHQVVLLPIDEWSDDSREDKIDTADKRSVWLPSFVLPGDPAVAKIIDSAQRYLMAISDDPAAGFDGYQQVIESDPESWSIVDDQVRAIWCALSFEAQLYYINPPPAFSATTQRLRTPSDVMGGRRGTCIDLALLFASCLEYVEIYPAVILLKGHAFPAYWRSAEKHNSFATAFSSGSTTASRSAAIDAADVTMQSRRTIDWAFENDARKFKEIMRCVRRDELTPVETVRIAWHESFATACDAGLENLSEPSEFEFLIDVIRARRNKVTPLPVVYASK